MERVTFTIGWAGGSNAKLLYVIDNGILIAKEIESNSGSISIPYDVERVTTHVLEWSLLFPGETRTKLEASYQRQGKDSVPLDLSDQATNRWASRGAA